MIMGVNSRFDEYYSECMDAGTQALVQESVMLVLDTKKSYTDKAKFIRSYLHEKKRSHDWIVNVCETYKSGWSWATERVGFLCCAKDGTGYRIIAMDRDNTTIDDSFKPKKRLQTIEVSSEIADDGGTLKAGLSKGKSF